VKKTRSCCAKEEEGLVVQKVFKCLAKSLEAVIAQKRQWSLKGGSDRLRRQWSLKGGSDRSEETVVIECSAKSLAKAVAAQR
jgi:hypothetical protein